MPLFTSDTHPVTFWLVDMDTADTLNVVSCQLNKCSDTWDSPANGS